MVKLFAIICVLVALTLSHQAEADRLKCDITLRSNFEDWSNMTDPCINEMRAQIQKEIYASTKYLVMAAHFARDTVNRPGFAEHFIKAAKEEREHGAKLIEYLSMRGELTKDVKTLIKLPLVEDEKWTGLSALKDAFKLEREVTASIRGLIKTCEGTSSNGQDNDYHLVDYLTGVYLEEQLTGQRDLAGKIATLEKMMLTHGELAEFLFDKKDM